MHYIYAENDRYKDSTIYLPLLKGYHEPKPILSRQRFIMLATILTIGVFIFFINSQVCDSSSYVCFQKTIEDVIVENIKAKHQNEYHKNTMFNYRVDEWKMLIDKFENFKVKFQKVYLDEKMNQLRMLRFVKKMEDDVMDQFNYGKSKIHFNPNRYADYFDYELKAILMSKKLMELKRQDANLKNEKQIKTKSSNDYVFE